MMDFAPRTPHQLIVSDNHSVKSCSLFSKTSYLDPKDRIDSMDTDSSTRNQSSDSEVEAATADYLRNAYAQLHENRYRKMNRLLSSIDDHQQSDNEDCDIAVLANNVANFGLKGNPKKTKPIITFTPVHSVDEQLADFQSPPGTSPLPSPVFESRGSSGSSSPMLEVPTPDFHNVALEMMRPPLH